MKIGVLGTGEVGRTLATGFFSAGHEVMMAGRTEEKARAWANEHNGAQAGTYTEAAGFGELVVLSVNGAVAVDVLMLVSGEVGGKVVIDTTNPLSFPEDKPMELLVANTDSIAEQLQQAVSAARVVKALNMMNSRVMVNPERLAGDHVACIAGNDREAREVVRSLLETAFGWKTILDLGDITAARGMESWMHLWLKLWGALGTAQFNIGIVR